VTLSGHGDDVVKIPVTFGAHPSLLSATHDGSANFIVEGLDANNKSVNGYINVIGAFNGTVPVNFGSFQTGALTLKVQADGSWTLTFKDPSTAKPFSTTVAGKGDDVLLYQGGSAVAAFTHNGQANFIVTTYSTDGSSANGLINEIGAYSGKQPLSSGPLLIAVEADGNWTITVQ
jgi:hypothetical protein